MRRFLVVGCGGSGGATLAYLMDQLRSDLHAHGVTALPRGWQFLHIDVPSAGEQGPDGVGNVAALGGGYLGTGPRGAEFPIVDQAVAHRLAERNAVHTIGTWAPRDPAKVLVPIAVGAGQYRSVGRLITLSRAADVHRMLRAAWEELFRVETATGMRELSGRVPGLGDYDDGPPLVLVVSSMAGGAGASMALDVCRLLSMVPGIQPSLTGVFMVAPNIFDSLPEASRTGVRPNALAMLGEIVAAQTGSARDHDVALLTALGLHYGADDGGPPFARVFPVGRYTGAEKQQFGDGRPQAVYRGLGRGLAGMIMSGTATSEFVTYDLAVPPTLNIDRNMLGWGSEAGHLPWGSYGFAALSMGRDRYAEYAAQRLGRSALTQLLDGHLQPGSAMAANEQVMSLLDTQWPVDCRRAGLPLLGGPATETEGEIGNWVTGEVFPFDRVDPAAAAVVAREVRDYVPDPGGQDARQWESGVRALLAQRRTRLAEACTAEAALLAHRWQDELRAAVERTVTDAVARLGLSYAVALVERAGTHVSRAVSPAVEGLTRHAPADVSALPPDVADELARVPPGIVRDGGPLMDQVLTGYRAQIRTQIYVTASGMVHQLLDGLVADVLEPLRGALAEAQHTLDRARRAPAVETGLAQLATEHVPSWPSDADEQVSGRFAHADNEVLLTTAGDFPAQYDTDLRRAPGGPVRSFAEARSTVVVQILSGDWPTVDAGQAPGTPLEVRSAWRSRVFAVDPSTGQPLTPAQARYDLHVRPAELLGRARAFVARRGESFELFCRLSMRDFVCGDGTEPDTELADRRAVVAAKFDQALTLARPLVGVDASALQIVHPGQQIAYRYKFSEVPFRGLELADELRRRLTGDPMLDPSSLYTLDGALGDSTGVTRIDVFGSYPNYSPLVFDAVLGPVAEQWARVPDLGRDGFWQWRRARPLAASLPMGDAERRAMVAGWFIGQVVGAVAIPEPPFRAPVRVWAVKSEYADVGDGEWLDFPHPLLTPPSRFLASFDWLPAVLESLLLAVARAQEPPVMSSLRPYRALRELYDTTSQEPVGGIHGLTGADRLRDWVRHGTSVPGGWSRVPGVDTATGPAERSAAAVAWLTGIRDLSRRYLPGGDRTGSTGRAAAAALPLFADLAADVNEMTGEIIRILTDYDPDDIPDPMDGTAF